MNISLANPTEMIQRGAPRVIHSEEELTEYTKALFELTAKPQRTTLDEEAIELLTVLIERYEATHYVIPEAEPADVLRFLLDHNGLSQRDIAADLGGESVVSLILGGKRQMNRHHIARLSQRFNVSPAAFFGGRVSSRMDSKPKGRPSLLIEQQTDGSYAIRRPTSREVKVRRTQTEALKAAKQIESIASSSLKQSGKSRSRSLPQGLGKALTK